MINDLIDVVEGEDTNLALHTRLCSLRYQQLLNKFDVVDEQLKELTNLCAGIKDSVIELKSNTQSTYLRWGGVIIITLIGILGGVIGRLV